MTLRLYATLPFLETLMGYPILSGVTLQTFEPERSCIWLDLLIFSTSSGPKFRAVFVVKGRGAAPPVSDSARIACTLILPASIQAVLEQG
jgi:hypothetical protein